MHSHWKPSKNGNEYMHTVTGGRFTVIAETAEGPLLMMHENGESVEERKARAERLAYLDAVDRLHGT
jgi:hypothetical protein